MPAQLAASGSQGDVVALDEDLHPVVEPPDHDRAHRAEPARVAARRLEARAGRGRRPRPTAIAWGTVNPTVALIDDAASRRLLDRLEAGGGRRELDLDVRREASRSARPARASAPGRGSSPGSSGATGGPSGRPRGRTPGARIAAPRTPISSISAQVSSTSDQVGCSVASSRTRGAQCARSFFITSPTMTGFEVAPVAAALDGVRRARRSRTSRSSSRSASSPPSAGAGCRPR